MLDIPHGDGFALTNRRDRIPHLDAVHDDFLARVDARGSKLVLGGHIRDQRVGPAVDRNLIALGQVGKRHYDVVFGVDSQGSVWYCRGLIHGYRYVTAQCGRRRRASPGLPLSRWPWWYLPVWSW